MIPKVIIVVDFEGGSTVTEGKWPDGTPLSSEDLSDAFSLAREHMAEHLADTRSTERKKQKA